MKTRQIKYPVWPAFDHFFGKRVLALLICIFVVFVFAPAQAQEVDDPLSKPEIWEKLKENPHNEGGWEAYFGVDLFTLNKEDYHKYNQWKSHLVQLKKEQQDKKEFERLKQQETYFEKRYGKGSGELDFSELRQNIHKNFAVIEQFFEEKFTAFGKEYKRYEEAHPESDYSKIKWVEDHELKLTLIEEGEELPK